MLSLKFYKIVFGFCSPNRKFISPVITTIATHHKVGSAKSESERVNSLRDESAMANAFAQKALGVRKSRIDHAEEVFERSKRMLESLNIPTIDCRYGHFSMPLQMYRGRNEQLLCTVFDQ